MLCLDVVKVLETVQLSKGDPEFLLVQAEGSTPRCTERTLSKWQPEIQPRRQIPTRWKYSTASEILQNHFE
jgi:hypothetical protein